MHHEIQHIKDKIRWLLQYDDDESLKEIFRLCERLQQLEEIDDEREVSEVRCTDEMP